MEQTVYLQLEDGTCLTGKHFGAPLKEDVIAEVVFTTAMTGYTETLTDPSYYGQMVVQTFPLIGNYGVNPKDFESKGIHMSAYITREWCPCPSNFRCQMDLDAFLKQQNVPGIYDLDTRYLTKLIRERGEDPTERMHHPSRATSRQSGICAGSCPEPGKRQIHSSRRTRRSMPGREAR